MPPRQMSDALSLRKEREESALPFSISPFVDPSTSQEPDGQPEEYDVGELRVKAPSEVPWIDLLLEIAMTTAFASLTDGTPILYWDNALSYFCYFIFVWWIWVSQVAYNMRFRQADWLHRIWVFGQLIVFCLLAAFTKDFDVRSGLYNNPDEDKVDQILVNQGVSLTGVKFRGKRLPRLNAQGVTVAMGVSRLLLLLQFTIVFYHARGLKRKSLLVQMVPLLFSALCYFVAFLVQSSTKHGNTVPSPSADIIKLVLWYFPILVEIISHFISLTLPGWVRYSTESVYARAASVFLIILGSGLDKITSGFKTLIGNAGLGWGGAPVFIATAVIFIGFFSLYFGTPGNSLELGNRRALLWLYSHFFFLAALIITLEATASSLTFANFNTALRHGDAALAPLFQWMNDNPGRNLTTEDFNSSEPFFNKLGLGLDGIVGYLNHVVALNDSNVIPTGQLYENMWLYAYTLFMFEAYPDSLTPLWASLENFLDASLDDTTTINRATFEDLHDRILKERGSSALWLYPAAGATILALVLISFVRKAPRDGWEWCVIICRTLIGSAICLLALLDIGSSEPIFDSEGKLTSCIIWVIAVGPNRMLLIILAVAMGVLQIIEHSIAYAANRPYHSFPSLNFLFKDSERRLPRRRPGSEYHYERTRNVDVIPLVRNPHSNSTVPGSVYSNPYDSPTYDIEFNPYHGLEPSGSTLHLRGG